MLAWMAIWNNSKTHQKVEAVEEGLEVASETQPVHLEEHLEVEERQENVLGEGCRVGAVEAAVAASKVHKRSTKIELYII